MKRRLVHLLRTLAPIAATALVVLSARASLADHYVVPTGSMQPTVWPGDHVLVDKRAYGLRVPFAGWELTEGERPQRGDVVVFDSPEDGRRLLKRVVAVGNDVIEVRGGRLWLSGQPAAADDAVGRPAEHLGDHVFRLDLSRGGGPDYGPQRVPPGHVVVMGDFRGNSRDSRVYGPIPESALYGRALGVFWRAGEGPVWEAF